ncbi:hypothetical protein RhiirA4_429528 [Rhizophagus irregularis]|uniref:Uncharacterized protein n=1 Tax=Rhizophagus irregularis TaxID=588596 RepID=A0A2I1HH40_9GLOM|nr:hypothetical protein RhiirA4_429528 [Rhizophagus irregularis]
MADSELSRQIFSIREKYLEGINSSGEDKRLERVLDYDPDKKRTTQEFVNTLSPMDLTKNLLSFNSNNNGIEFNEALEPLDICVNFPVAEITYTADLSKSFSN